MSEASPHIANIGRMVEDMENKIRNTLNEIYFGKTKDIVNGLRSVQPLADQKQQAMLQQDLAAALRMRQAKGENWTIKTHRRTTQAMIDAGGPFGGD